MKFLRWLPGLAVLIALASACSFMNDRESRLYSDVDTTEFSKGDVVLPFHYINPREKGWKIVIEISGDDLASNASVVTARRFSSSRPAVLRRVRDWKFIYNAGDLATVTSTILIYKNGTLVDQQGLVLEKDSVGLQSIKFGWITPVERSQVINTLSMMDKGTY